jgi:hypothetical protein
MFAFPALAVCHWPVGLRQARRAGLYLRLDDILELVTIGTVRDEAASLTSAKHEDLFHSRSVALG